MRVLVCGSRTFSDVGAIESLLKSTFIDAVLGWSDGNLTILEGGAPGADEIACNWARRTPKVSWIRYGADWEKHGKAAGPIRNQRMLDEGKPDVVLAFVDKALAESRGTADMVKRARTAKVPVYVIEKKETGDDG